MILAGGALMLVLAVGLFPAAVLLAALTALTEGGMAALIVVAAGGYGYLLIRRLLPRSASTALCVLTACALGLWVLSSAVLVVGSAFTGALKAWVWWPVVAGGVILAAWFGRKSLERWRIRTGFDGRALVWVVLAAAVGLWIAGATRPPGLIRTPDTYDVLEYHLQVPREFYNAQHIGPLNHNCYSFYPLGVEMLFLLGMALRGGAYEGMYAAKMIHGAFGVLAVAAVFGALKKDDDGRARFSAALLGTAPFVVYLSWLAMVELAMMCYLALGVLWMREWLKGGGWRESVCIGLMLGASCSVKYLSVGLIAGPVLAAMIVISLSRPGRAKDIAYVPLTVVATVLLFCPWLIRNHALTGNPVFPLATETFGRGHWSAESAQRWVDGHGPEFRAPVPPPPGWSQRPTPTRAEMFYHNFMTEQQFGPILLLLAGVAVCVMIAAGSKSDPWDWSLALILLGQIAVWMAFTHGMPSRFLAPALVPMALLAGGVLAQLGRVRTNPFRRVAPVPSTGAWGRPPAIALLATAIAVNLLIAYFMYDTYTAWAPQMHGVPGDGIASTTMKDAGDLPEGSRIMLLGEARAFYFPPDTVYATTFDAQSLDPIARKLESGEMTREQALAELRRMNVTHIWVDWRELFRLGTSYGFPASLSAELVERARANRPAGMKLFDLLGLRVASEIERTSPTTAPADATWWETWPLVTVYALPWAPTTAPAISPADAPSAPVR